MISVCMATYNGEKYLKEQIDSILCQLNSNDELIISDDGSTDGTIEIIEGYNDGRIKLYKNSFHNFVANFEFALKQVQGDYVFLCDQDDIWLENKIATMSGYLDEYDLVMSDCRLIAEDKSVLFDSYFQLRKSHKGLMRNLIINSYMGCCMAFRRQLLSYVLPFPHQICSHDMWIGLVAELKGNIFLLPQQLILHRRHGRNASATGEKSRYSLWHQLVYRCQMIWCLGRFYCRGFMRNN